MSTFSQEELEQALKQCEAEPIHQIGQIQPHGVLLVLSTDNQHVVLQASENFSRFFDLPNDNILGKSLVNLVGETAAIKIEEWIQVARNEKPVAGNLSLYLSNKVWALQTYLYVSDGLYVLELVPDETVHQESRLAELLLQMEQELLQSHSGTDSEIYPYFDQISRLVRSLSGYDSVMVYRFDGEWNGEVIAQSRIDSAPSYLGLHFPASDIPPQARRLYTRNLVRLVANIDATPVNVVPVLNPVTQQPLDMTNSALRSLSPIHIQYLRNIGTKASMVISLLQNGRLWGLIACHHMTAKQVSFSLREAVTFISQLVSSKLSSLEERDQHQYISKTSHVIEDLLKHVLTEEEEAVLQRLFPELMALLDATGMLVMIEGKRYVHGEVPKPAELDALIAWLSNRHPSEVFISDHLAKQFPPANDYKAIASGILSGPLSPDTKNCMIWLRKEKPKTVNWAGNAEKYLSQNSDGSYHLTPRKSFEIWTESWLGRSAPWTYLEQGIGAMLAITIPDSLSKKILLNRALNQQQQTYEALTERHRKFYSVIQTIGDGFWQVDSQGYLLEVNPAYARLSGYSEPELIGMHITNLEARETTAETAEHIRKIIEQGSDIFETVHRRKDGSLWEAEVSTTFIKEDGMYFIVLIRDITERKRVSNALLNSYNLLQSVIDTAPVRIFWKDLNLRYLGCNRIFAIDAGEQNPTDVIGKDDFQLAWREQAEIYRADDFSVMNSGLAKLNFEEPQTTKDGHQIWLNTSKIPLLNDTGEIIGLLGVYSDITDSKCIGAELEQ